MPGGKGVPRWDGYAISDEVADKAHGLVIHLARDGGWLDSLGHAGLAAEIAWEAIEYLYGPFEEVRGPITP
jgi:hypothetical protein